MASKKRISLVQLAAKLYGCPMADLLSYREYEDGSVVIIAPSGQKFTYSAESIMQFVLREESPPAPLDKGGAEASEGPEVPMEPEVAEVPEAPEELEVPKAAKVTKVANEHAGAIKRSR